MHYYIQEENTHRKSIHWCQEPGRIDGGDVVRVGDIFYIGKSKRSNDEGISQFQDFLTCLMTLHL